MQNLSKHINSYLLFQAIGGVMLLVCLNISLSAQDTFSPLSISFPSHIKGESNASWLDYDLDGDMDVLLNGEISALLINEDGVFTDQTAELIPNLNDNQGKGKVVWGDLNNDGNIDFIRNVSFLGEIKYEIYLQNEFGGFDAPFLMGTDSMSDILLQQAKKIKELGLFDFDADGDLDIYIENINDEIEILCNHTLSKKNIYSNSFFTSEKITHRFGAGMLVKHTDKLADMEGEWETKDKRNLFDAFFDFDADGDFDAIVISPLGVKVWMNEGKGNWTKRKNLIPLGEEADITGVVGSDIDNDGDIDLIFHGYAHTYILMNESDSKTSLRFAQPQILPSLYSCSELQMVDIDNDGDLDIHAVVDGKHLFLENNLYGTNNHSSTHLTVEILDKNMGNIPHFKFAHGASALLRDLNGNVISPIQKVSGGLGEGKQSNLELHFGFPAEYQKALILEVHAPSNYVNGNLEHKTIITKIIYPTQLPSQKVSILINETSRVKMM